MPRPNPETKIVRYETRIRTDSYPSWKVTYVDNVDWTRNWTGNTSPGFPGNLRVNPHIADHRWARRDPSFYYYIYNGSSNWTEYRGPARNLPGGPPDSPINSLASAAMADEVRATARSRLISKISRQKVNIAQNIGEYRQVQNMFLSNTRRLADAYRALRRGDIRGLQRHFKHKTQRDFKRTGRLARDQLIRNPSSWWLELQYGWLPLVGDVYDGMTEFYRRVEQGVTIKEIAGASRKWDAYNPSVQHNQYIFYSRATSRRAVCKTGITYTVDSARLANLQDWGVLNPLLLAWELMPYSFVVDWFVPVGDWLANVGYSMGLTFREGFESYLVQAESTRVYKPGVPPPQYPNYRWVCKGTDTFGESTFKREKLYSFPASPMPTLEQGLRGKRIANALALLGVAFGRRR